MKEAPMASNAEVAHTADESNLNISLSPLKEQAMQLSYQQLPKRPRRSAAPQRQWRRLPHR